MALRKGFLRITGVILCLFCLWEVYFVLKSLTLKEEIPFDKDSRRIFSSQLSNRRDGVRWDFQTANQLKPILENVLEINMRQYVRNGKRLRFKLGTNSVVIIVQVHDRLQELQYLIESLERARNIEKCLVIFSHDLYSEDINDVIRDIKSFPVMQIFYPFSVQLNPYWFPGQDPKDCPWNISIQEAQKIQCSNVNFSDSFYHFREARVSQMKHHWTWQLRFVIKRVRMLQNFHGVFLRLDEDYYLSEDAIYFLQEMNKLRRGAMLHIAAMVLGDYDEIPSWSFEDVANKVKVRKWRVGIGRGLAFTRVFWEKLKHCSSVFCFHDDYNWDWSLQETIDKCMGGTLYVFQAMASRVYHTGLCHGFHANRKGCSPNHYRQEILKLLIENEQYLFPEVLMISEHSPIEIGHYRSMPNGGWSDPRDHQLCQKLFLER